MNGNTKKLISGVSLALAAAAMTMAATASQGGGSNQAAAGNTADLVHCYDVNICKGHNDCKTADNACAGHATCKGTGFVAMSAKACGDIGGKVGA